MAIRRETRYIVCKKCGHPEKTVFTGLSDDWLRRDTEMHNSLYGNICNNCGTTGTSHFEIKREKGTNNAPLS